MTDETFDVEARSRELTRFFVEGTARLQREIGYNPTRFNQLVGELGGVGAAKQLLEPGDAATGLTTLWERQRLGLSVEAIVQLPRFAALFTEAERAEGRRRLEQLGFDVDLYMRQIADGLP